MIRQPPGSNLCGQCCVAHVARCSLEEVIKIVGRGTTTGLDIIYGCLSLGVKCDCFSRRVGKQGLPLHCIARVHWDGSGRSHWVVIEDGRVLDPEGDLIENARFTSYVEILQG
jgi:hypothetical protein